MDWRQVKEIHDSFKYSNSGLGPASQIIIAIVMAAVVGPLAAGAAASAGAGVGVAAGAGAVAAGAATNATVSVVNNRGNLGAVLKDVTSSDAMKGYVIAGVTAGMTAAYFGDWTGTQTNTITGKVTTPGLLNTWSGVGKFAANQTLQSGTSMLLSKALGQGGSASDALKSALFNTLAAASFNLVGNYTQGVVADGSAPKIAIHAMVGGLLAEATGGDFKTGALAAGANEALVTHLNTLVNGNEELLTMSSQIVGVLAAAGQKDADAAKIEKGAWVAQNLTQYNFLEHLPPGLSEYGSAATTLAKDMLEKGATNDQIAQAQLELAQGQGFEGVQPANEFVKAWGYFMAGELTGAGLAAVLGRLVMGGAKGLPSALQNFGGRTFDDLSAAASNPINKEGLTEAARALTKHASGQRATGTFPKLTGGIEKQNATALGIIDDVLKNPNSTFSNLSRGGLEVRAPDGRGLRYNNDGSFSGFLDPKAKP
ncbi:hypothetical protein SRABI111_01681 [Pseudomonas carnis]|nr:hypothetical protein SRABI111_01681 [Pseudomonas carnis]CAH0194813.1 hypothetical protein SRABI64_01584 [Pseudomonas carnis]CAH0220921.1 hypothetical protein SRABI110_02481 [Pseudomonas carnis]CAH0222999.1 hypothetical protein SRABI08_02419 [Pseudomonas carnis]